MSFKPNYYKPLTDYIFELLKLPLADIPFDKEILQRDLASRLYYSAFLHCHDILITNNAIRYSTDSRGSHEDIILSLNKQFEDELRSLKKIRVLADYNLLPFTNPIRLSFKEPSVYLLRAKAISDDILQKTFREIKKR